MGIAKPYRRTFRQFKDGIYFGNMMEAYLEHPKYAQSPAHYIRAYLILLKDMQELFDYVEPADDNLQCYSYRIHELLLRACVEIEANCKAILIENGYTKSGRMTMNDNKKIEASHRLSAYEIRMPFWRGAERKRCPFSAWQTSGTLPWYEAYNAAKHDRHNAFDKATLEHMTDAMSGLIILLSSQFFTCNYGACNWYHIGERIYDGMQPTTGHYFRIKYPHDWPVGERYDFWWPEIQNETDPFQNYPYPS